jgi:hypothetical protein
MPDRYDDEIERLRSVEVPDQWDDISRRAADEPVSGPADLDGLRRRVRWPLLLAAAAVLVLVAGSAAVVLRDDDQVTEIEPTGTTAERPDSPAQQPPPSVSLSLPPGAVTSCRGMVFGASGDPAGHVPVPGPADPPLVPADAMAGVNSTWHSTNGDQTMEIHFPATRVADLVGERTETVETVWGEATLRYAPYGLADAVQIRVPLSFSPPCNLWDITVRGPDQAANRALAIETATPSTSGTGG